MPENRIERYLALDVADVDTYVQQGLMLTRFAASIAIRTNSDLKSLDTLYSVVIEEQRQNAVDKLLTIFTSTGMRYMLEDLEMQRMRLQLRVNMQEDVNMYESPQVSVLRGFIRTIMDKLLKHFRETKTPPSSMPNVSNVNDALFEIGYLNVLEQLLYDALDQQKSYILQSAIESQDWDVENN